MPLLVPYEQALQITRDVEEIVNQFDWSELFMSYTKACSCGRGLVDHTDKCYLCRQESASAQCGHHKPAPGEYLSQERERRRESIRRQIAELQNELRELG